jgi:hypothetical protein
MRANTNISIPSEAKGDVLKFEQPLNNRLYLIKVIADCRKRINSAKKFKFKNAFERSVKLRNYDK